MFCSYKDMYDSIDNEKVLIDKRLEMVRYANDNGIKVAARFYKCSKNTIKKWCRRYAIYGYAGLKDKSRRPIHSPKRIPDNDIIKIKETCDYAKEKGKYITVNNVRKRTGIKDYSDVTMNGYINEACGKRKNLKHTQPKGGDVSTGFPIVAYCNEKSATYTKMFLEKILYEFLIQFDSIDLKSITIQTDNGKEFTNKYTKTNGKSPKETNFTLYVYCKFKKHKTNPPGSPTYDSDVESFHWSIERDCLAWDDIVDNESLIKYTTEYITNYINTEIKTRGYSPLDKIKTAYEIDKIQFPKPQLLTV